MENVSYSLHQLKDASGAVCCRFKASSSPAGLHVILTLNHI